MQAPTLDEHALIALVVGAGDVRGLRRALSLPADLGPHESRFAEAAARVFTRMGKETGTGEPLHFGSGWVELFNQSIHELQLVLRTLPGPDPRA